MVGVEVGLALLVPLEEVVGVTLREALAVVQPEVEWLSVPFTLRVSAGVGLRLGLTLTVLVPEGVWVEVEDRHREAEEVELALAESVTMGDWDTVGVTAGVIVRHPV